MKNKLCCNPVRRLQATSRQALLFLLGVAILVCVPPALAGDAPQWVHEQVNAPLPSYDEKTDAVLLYSETDVSVLSADKIRTHVREAYKIVRPEGRHYGTILVLFNSHKKVTSLHGWCIPAQGKDFEVKDKDAVEVSLPNIQGSELITDVKAKVLHIPAPDPGNVIGYEYEVEEQPFVLQDTWSFQQIAPARQSLYSVQLPAGWEYKASWLNHPEIKPTQAASNQWNWTVSDMEGIRREHDMPPMEGVAAQMVISFFPPGGAVLNEFTTWQGMGAWYLNLTSGRRDPSAEIKQQVARLTASAHTPLEKMQAIAQFVQHDIRYVAIELGIGGWQPHPAPDVFSHRYGDCKDKATLTAAMLNEIGVQSYYLLINAKRGSVGPDTPARANFNHAILAIKLPDGLTDPSLIATIQHPKLGRLLFFDPTNELTPFGQIGGYLQSNYGLLVTPYDSELVELPRQPATTNSIQRTAKLTLNTSGRLQGDVKEVRFGDRAWSERWALRSITKSTDQIKLIESLLADSLASFRITRASIVNLQLMDQPFGFNYSFESENYAKNAGNLLLVRPRVLGVKSEALLETKEPRKFPVEFEAPLRDTDTFEITLPAGYEVDDLPAPVDADYSFASYHSKTEATGGAIRYTRTFEIKELSVPVSRADDLKTFYRTIATDERNTAVLKISSK
jgi:predicted transglutaminase-like cysteine proteinase